MKRSIAMIAFPVLLLAQKSSLPDGAGKDVVQRVCSQCHAVDIFIAKGNTRDGWTQIVTEMISRGAQGSDEDFGTVIDYLTTQFPPRTNVNTASAADLQDGLAFTGKQAAAVLDYRKQNGRFKSLDELKKVPGLDPEKLEAEKARIAF